MTKREIKARLLEMLCRYVVRGWQGDRDFASESTTAKGVEAHRQRVEAIALDLRQQLSDKADRLRLAEAAYQERRKW